MRAVFREAAGRKFLGQTEFLGFGAGGVDDSPLGVCRAFLPTESHFVKDHLAVGGHGDRLRGTQRGPILETEWMLLRRCLLRRFLGERGNRRETKSEKYDAANSWALGCHKFISSHGDRAARVMRPYILAWLLKLFVTLFRNLLLRLWAKR